MQPLLARRFMSKNKKDRVVKLPRSWLNVHCWFRGHVKMKMKKGKGSYKRVRVDKDAFQE
jgi:stalled ribosome alternative rescue factor ArfA